MIKKVTKRTLKDMLLLIVAMTFFTIVGLRFMPILSIIIPAPFVVFSLSDNKKLGILSFIIVTLSISVALNYKVGLIFIIIFLPLIYILISGLSNNRSIRDILTSSAILFLISIIIILLISQQYIDIKSYTNDIVEQTIDRQVLTLKESDIELENMKDIRKSLELLYKYLIIILPSLIIILGLIISYINLTISIKGLVRNGIQINSDVKFEKFKIPQNMIWGIILIFILNYIFGKVGFEYTDEIKFNLIILIGFFILLQGYAVFTYYFNRKNFNKVLKVILFILSIFLLPIASIIQFIGFIDILIDFRRLEK